MILLKYWTIVFFGIGILSGFFTKRETKTDWYIFISMIIGFIYTVLN